MTKRIVFALLGLTAIPWMATAYAADCLNSSHFVQGYHGGYVSAAPVFSSYAGRFSSVVPYSGRPTYAHAPGFGYSSRYSNFGRSYNSSFYDYYPRGGSFYRGKVGFGKGVPGHGFRPSYGGGSYIGVGY